MDQKWISGRGRVRVRVRELERELEKMGERKWELW
jgi:hypothetical protein